MGSENGLELSFMVNYLAKCILNKELMPLLEKNGNSRVIFMVPKSNLSIPDLNKTPFGQDFHWSSTVSKTITCSIMSFLSLVKKTKDSNIPVTLVQSGNTYNTLVKPTNGCISCAVGIFNKYLNDPPNVIAKESLAFFDAIEFKDFYGKFFKKGLNEPTDMQTLNSISDVTVGEWEQWTRDFLSRN